MDECNLEIKGGKDCVEQPVSDESDRWIIDAAGLQSQEKWVGEVTLARMRGGWA